MRLKQVRIQNYKSIDDSGEFSIGDLTCLAGKNESGKTAILQALRRLNPVEREERAFDITMEFPRKRLHESEDGNARVLTTTWELDDDDVTVVEARLGPGALATRTVVISKGYGSASLTWQVPIDEAQLIRGLAGQADDLPASAAERLSKVGSVAAFRESVAKAGAAVSTGEKRILAALDAFREGRPTLAAIDALNDRVPRFLYFATYEAMPGRVVVEDLIAKRDDPEQGLDQEDRIFLALLALARTSLEEVRDEKLSEALIAKLEGVSNAISSAIFTYWSQNRNLRVRHDFREVLPNDPEFDDENPDVARHLFLTRVENLRHGVSVGFDELECWLRLVLLVPGLVLTDGEGVRRQARDPA